MRTSVLAGTGPISNFEGERKSVLDLLCFGSRTCSEAANGGRASEPNLCLGWEHPALKPLLFSVVRSRDGPDSLH